jgi:MFS-type transporter involved in bile tolerance (Atg22 family)
MRSPTFAAARWQAQWSHSVTAAALGLVLGAPALGAIADGLGRRKAWLLAFTALTVAGPRA